MNHTSSFDFWIQSLQWNPCRNQNQNLRNPVTTTIQSPAYDKAQCPISDLIKDAAESSFLHHRPNIFVDSKHTLLAYFESNKFLLFERRAVRITKLGCSHWRVLDLAFFDALDNTTTMPGDTVVSTVNHHLSLTAMRGTQARTPWAGPYCALLDIVILNFYRGFDYWCARTSNGRCKKISSGKLCGWHCGTLDDLVICSFLSGLLDELMGRSRGCCSGSFLPQTSARFHPSSIPAARCRVSVE